MTKFFLYIALIVISLSSCAKKTQIEKVEKLPGKSVKYLQTKVEENKLNFESLSARFNARTNFNNEKLSFKGIVKIKADSIIWLSMTKLGGVEIVRLILTQDSIKFINKWDKEYYMGPIEKLNNIESIELGFSQIQEMLIGAMIDYNPEDKFNSGNDDGTYLLSSRNKAKVKKSLTIIEGDSLMEISKLDEKMQKLLDKNSGEDFVVKNYYLLPDNYYLARQTISLIELQQVIDINYSEYAIIDDAYVFALEQVIRIASNEKSGRVDLSYSSIEFNVDNVYPFKISSKYEPFKKRK
jgi:outer membrane lipoprotein-sorting protein